MKHYGHGKKWYRTYSNKEAIQRAVELAKKDIKSKVDEDAIIKDEKILHQEMKNGKVILDIHFKIVENIAVGNRYPRRLLNDSKP